MNNIHNNNQTGRSMIEMLAVLMIMGILTVGVMAGFNQMISKYNASKMHADIHSIYSEVVNLYAWQRNFPPAFDSKELCENDIFPDGCTGDKKDEALNPFDGSYDLTPNEDGTLTIEANNIDPDACKDLCLREWDNLYETDYNPDCRGCDSGDFFVTFN